MVRKYIFACLVALPFATIAQKSDSDFCKMISDSLPGGWKAILEKGTITVVKLDSVWFYNGINAPVEMTPSDHPPFASNKGQYRMEIKVLPGWSNRQMRSAVKKNTEILNRIYEKYRMSEITNKNGDYAPKNDDEQQRVEAYYKECEQVQPQLAVIPTINLDKNSFVIRSSISDTGMSIWPDKISGEIFNTEAKIYSILRKQ
jgi:hypothetical protein